MGASRGRISFPTWVRTLGAIVDEGGVEVKVRCQTCGAQRPVDIPALIEKKGREYSLINRRCKCRLTRGCLGWNVFNYSTGTWSYHLYDDATVELWDNKRRAAQQQADCEAAMTAAKAFCEARGWNWAWKLERTETHWQVSVEFWSYIEGKKAYHARSGTSGHAQSWAPAMLVEHGADYCIRHVEQKEEQDRRIAERRAEQAGTDVKDRQI